MDSQEQSEQWVDEVIVVPTEVEVDEIVEVEIFKDVVEERKISQVKALYAFTGQGMDMAKGEVRP